MKYVSSGLMNIYKYSNGEVQKPGTTS